jgi:hypothetical protein
MADGQVKVQSVPGGDKTIDNTELLVGGATVERQRVQLGGAGAAELADVRGGTPAAGDLGLVTRNLPTGTQAISTAAGAQVDGHSATLGTTADSAATNTLIGRLQQLLARIPAALVGGRLDINLGAAPVTVTTDVSDRAARLVGHVTVDTLPAAAARTRVILSATGIASVAAEALMTLQKDVGGVVTTGITEYVVTAGKTLRVQYIRRGVRFTTMSTTVTFANTTIKLRESSTTLAVASPLVDADNLAAASNVPTPDTMGIFPDGLEFPAGTHIGFTHVGSATTLSQDVMLVGYEY